MWNSWEWGLASAWISSIHRVWNANWKWHRHPQWRLSTVPAVWLTQMFFRAAARQFLPNLAGIIFNSELWSVNTSPITLPSINNALNKGWFTHLWQFVSFLTIFFGSSKQSVFAALYSFVSIFIALPDRPQCGMKSLSHFALQIGVEDSSSPDVSSFRVFPIIKIFTTLSGEQFWRPLPWSRLPLITLMMMSGFGCVILFYDAYQILAATF